MELFHDHEMVRNVEYESLWDNLGMSDIIHAHQVSTNTLAHAFETIGYFAHSLISGLNDGAATLRGLVRLHHISRRTNKTLKTEMYRHGHHEAVLWGNHIESYLRFNVIQKCPPEHLVAES